MKMTKTRKFFYAVNFIFLFLFSLNGLAFAEYDISGRWLLEGGGEARKGISVRLTVDGYLDVTTTVSEDVEFLAGYDTHVRLDASRLNIKAWDYDDSVTQDPPFPIPHLDPTMDNPIKLPPVTVDDMTYQLTFTSTTSGVVKIYGTLDVDHVGSVRINSESTIWKKGTKRPNIDDKASGCNGGLPAFLASFVVLSHVIVYNRKDIF